MHHDIEADDGSGTKYPDRYAPIPPNGGHCEISGLGHARMYALLNGPAAPHVRVANLRESGKKRGKTLFHVGDLLRYFDQLAAQRLAPKCSGVSKILNQPANRSVTDHPSDSKITKPRQDGSNSNQK